MMKIESSRQVWTKPTNKGTDIVTPWAWAWADGAKNDIYMFILWQTKLTTSEKVVFKGSCRNGHDLCTKCTAVHLRSSTHHTVRAWNTSFCLGNCCEPTWIPLPSGPCCRAPPSKAPSWGHPRQISRSPC